MAGIPLHMAPTAPAPMEYRHVGRSELVASAIGFGCRPLGGAFGPVSAADAIATIRQAMTVGINCFDTAPRYGFGRAEELLGQALGRWRREVNVITKVGYTWDPSDPERTVRHDSSRAAVLDGVGGLHASLRRLGTDYVDLVLVEVHDTRTPVEETLAALVERTGAGQGTPYWGCQLQGRAGAGRLATCAADRQRGGLSPLRPALGARGLRDVPDVRHRGTRLGHAGLRPAHRGAHCGDDLRRDRPAPQRGFLRRTYLPRRSSRRTSPSSSACGALPVATAPASPNWRSRGCCTSRR